MGGRVRQLFLWVEIIPQGTSCTPQVTLPILNWTETIGRGRLHLCVKGDIWAGIHSMANISITRPISVRWMT